MKPQGPWGPGSGGCPDHEPTTSGIAEAAVNPGISTFRLWTGGQHRTIPLTPVGSKSEQTLIKECIGHIVADFLILILLAGDAHGGRDIR